MSERINNIIDDIKEQYLEDDNNIPWIIGFSGGKDRNANRQMPCVAIMGGTHTANEQAEKGSHAWVIDGYAICTKTSREILRNNDLYFHANMGWGGPDNGFYKVNADASTDFETTLGTYNINFWEITEIHKK